MVSNLLVKILKLDSVKPHNLNASTVRLKYDDTHSDQKFSESELSPLITWKRPLNAHETPTKRLLIAWKRPFSAWKRPRNEGVELSFREFLVRMGAIIFETLLVQD